MPDDATTVVTTPDLPIVETKYGRIRGDRSGGTLRWRSIPYAAPISGPNRFRAPRPPEPWDGVRDCTRFADIALQSLGNAVPIDATLRQGPDCLWCTVWSPAADDARHPVMVWLHGGAYCLGTAAQPIYNGRHLAETGDVVIVTVNYRLGANGFVDFSSFSTPDAVFESNLGLRDMIAALEWVRDNIANFGGDPDNVTVFGESSGAGSITTLLTSPKAEGLFHRAIAQSSPATSVYGAERAAGVARRFLELAELSPERAGELYDLPDERIGKAADLLIDEVARNVPGTLATAPVVDGDVVPYYPVAAFRNGASHKVPLIIGSNKDEASLFRMMRSALLPVTPGAVEQMFQLLLADHPTLSHDRLAEIAAAYPTSKKSALAMTTDAGFRMPTLWVADGHSRHAPTWVYRFDHATPMLKAARVGATHASELSYVFGTFGSFSPDPTFWLGGRKTALEVAGRVQRRWLAFAHHGVPAALDGSKHWAPYDETNRDTLLIDTADTLAHDPEKALRAAWGDKVMAFS